MMTYSLLLSFVLIGSTISCSCIMRPTLSEDFANTAIIFIGRVIKKVSPPTSFGNIEYTMEVEEAFKGTSVGAHIKIFARKDSAACGIGIISINDRRQIWATESGITNSCTRTTSNINEDRTELQKLANHSS